MAAGPGPISTTFVDESKTHHVFLIPGLFGFATLAGYDYFGHLERGISERFAAAGVPVRIERVPSLPTSSIRARAVMVARTVARGAEGSGPIHLVGHSSGGLDARLVLSPGTRLQVEKDALDWTSRARTVIGMNAPHYGTPLAAYFATVSGTRFLYAVSLLTVTSLSLGKLPLTGLAGLVSVAKAVDDSLGLDIRLVDDVLEQVSRFVGERGRREIHDFLQHIRDDQSGIVQLMPEVADLFNASVADRAGVRYGCVVTSAPPPTPGRVLEAALSPAGALGLAVYTTLYGVASRASRRYGYAVPTPEQARALSAGLRRKVGPENVDGVVPTLSMLWGDVVWCGAADHLDVVGHFEDGGRDVHVDWLRSGAHFKRSDFAAMVDSMCRFMLRTP
jgi:triacylglycerol esterase/lipase EstA (alpha/beta hydrolase family)